MKRIHPLLVAAALGGCSGVIEDPESRTAIDQYIRSLDPLPTEPSVVVEGEKSAPERDGDYACTTQDFSETRQYDRVVAFATNSESMWPGAILHGDSVYSGLFTQAVFARKPLTVSVSLENIAGARSSRMDSPSLSSFREAIGEILSKDVTGDTPANIYAEIDEVHSSSQLALAVGAGFSIAGAPFSISTSFNFSDQNIRSRYLVKYTQAYYTVDVDQPGRPSDFLAAEVSVDDIAEAFGQDDPPVYVSSITYGRTVLFTFESEFSALELGSALDFVYSGGADVSGNVSVTYEDMVSRSRITAYILGGSGGAAVQSIDGYEALREFIRTGGNYSRQSPGAPIAYKLAYLANNAPARVSFTQDYQVKDCLRVSQKIKVTLDSITVESVADEVGSGDDLEIFGRITASADTEVTLMDLSRSQFLRIRANESYPPTSSSPLGEGVLQVTPQPGASIRLIADLYEADSFGDDNWAVVSTEYRFETGWRRTVSFPVSDGDARVRLTFTLQPI